MGEMEEKLGAILSNPDMMRQIMSMAQAFGSQPDSPPAQPPPPPSEPAAPQLDLSLVQKISGLARQSGIDQREQALLRALKAYLSIDRITKLEKAMRAAKMARLASTALGSGGLQSLFGR